MNELTVKPERKISIAEVRIDMLYRECMERRAREKNLKPWQRALLLFMRCLTG